MERSIQLIIHNVRSAHNVGSLFRTADGMGVSHVYLTGYTPAPIDRFGRKDARIAKVSLRAEESVSWSQEDISDVLKSLKKQNVEVVSLEQAPGSVLLHTYKPKANVALVVGNEVDGVPNEVLEKSDVVVEISMHGEKESLNVSNAGSIALHHLRNTSS